MKEKIFKKFTANLNKMNKSDVLSDYHFSKIYDLAEKLADKEYHQGRADALEDAIKLARAEIDFESQAEQKRFVEFMESLKEERE